MSAQSKKYLHAINHCDLVTRSGKVLQFYGLVLEASGPDVFLGELCEIYSSIQLKPVTAEVVGFKEGKVLLIPYGELKGVRVGSEIIATGKSASVSVGERLKGRVIDAFGNPLDGKPLDFDSSADHQDIPLYPEPLNPLSRERSKQRIDTGVKAIDTFLGCVKGQRVGIFAGSGVGKSTLLAMIARNTSADINVIALIGERGREVLEFIEDALGDQGLKKSIVVVATADQPALVRTHAAYVATAIAEYFRAKSNDVILTMDSITRFAMAQREIGLSIGEPPTMRGYTPSVFANLPKILERAGSVQGEGSITAFYTVLVEGDDLSEPVSDALRAILDGHIVLSREVANRGVYPAIDLLQSVSRLANSINDDTQKQLLEQLIRLLSIYQESKDIIDIGAYEEGSNQELDLALKVIPKLEAFLRQRPEEKHNTPESFSSLENLLKQSEQMNAQSKSRHPMSETPEQVMERRGRERAMRGMTQ